MVMKEMRVVSIVKNNASRAGKCFHQTAFREDHLGEIIEPRGDEAACRRSQALMLVGIDGGHAKCLRTHAAQSRASMLIKRACPINVMKNAAAKAPQALNNERGRLRGIDLDFQGIHPSHLISCRLLPIGIIEAPTEIDRRARTVIIAGEACGVSSCK